MTFDRIVVVNLARRPDRLEGFLERFYRAWPDGPIEVANAVDGQLCEIPSWWDQPSGAWGCYQSHLAILQNASSEGLESILIFEDDATFVDGFLGQLEELLQAVPDDWAQLYLGGQHLKTPRRVSDLVVAGRNVNRTHAYAIRGPGRIAEVCDWLEPGHHWAGRKHVDHHFGRLHQRGGWPVYAPRAWICGQAAGSSDVSNRKERERSWNR